MKHLFCSWDTFASDVKAAPHILLLSDYDGTLTPIVGRPDEAVLAPEVREQLHILSESPVFSVGIISGRSLVEVKGMVGLDGIYYVGNHGMEIAGPGISFVNAEAQGAQEVIKHLAERLSDQLSDVEGVIVEDKGLSLSVHYRLVEEAEVKRVTDIFQQSTGHLREKGRIRVTSGKKVWEVRPPVDWHKGKAVVAIRVGLKARYKLERLMTIYLGDDTTDEDAFGMVKRPQGWSIFVGGENPASSADYFLNSTSEVGDFLSRLLGLNR